MLLRKLASNGFVDTGPERLSGPCGAPGLSSPQVPELSPAHQRLVDRSLCAVWLSEMGTRGAGVTVDYC